MAERPGARPSSREALRLDGMTWRHLERITGDACHDCGRCDRGADGHYAHQCSLSPGWFAGTMVVCAPCFADRIRGALSEGELTGIAVRAATGDPEALRRVRDKEAS
jgi:hypothetical protein